MKASLQKRARSFAFVIPVSCMMSAGYAIHSGSCLWADDDLVRDPAPRPVQPAALRIRNGANFGGGGAIVVNGQMPGRITVQQVKLQSTIEDLDRICHLTGPQKRKLELIGRRDQARIASKEKLDGQVVMPQQINQRLFDQRNREVLQRKQSIDLDAGAFFVKSLSRVLTDEQINLLKEHRRTQLGKSISATVDEIDRMVTLTDQQRVELKEKLIEFNLYSFPLAEKEVLASHPERLLMLYQLAAHADDSVKPLLTDEQWRRIVVRLKKFESFGTELKTRGLIASNDEGKLNESNNDDSK